MVVKVLICGGGNGAHVMAGVAAGQPDVDVHVLTLFADEAERWTNAMKDGNYTVLAHNADGSTTTHQTKPSLVTKDAALAMKDRNLVVFVVPAFAHAQYLDALKAHVKPGLVLAGLPGQAGFEFAVRGAWGDLAKQTTILSFESLPWACRIKEFGKYAEVLGTKATLQGASLAGATAPPEDATAMLQKCLGPLPKLLVNGHLLGITLMGVNAYVHTCIMYGEWKKWDGKPLNEPPLFYNGLTRESADLLSAVGDEIVGIAKAVMQQRPAVDLSNVCHIKDWYLRCYSKDVSDKTDLYTIIQTNKAYKGLTHPTKKTDDGKYLPDFGYRYMTEDVPSGLVVMKGIAVVAGLATPNIDMVLDWCQSVMGKEYIKGGQLVGKDMPETRSPQRYVLTTMDAMLGLD